jgi:hypothetical protein
MVATIIGVGMYLGIDGSWKARAARLLVALMLIPLAYLPNLLVAEDWASYRTQPALAALLLLYAAIALFGWLRALRIVRAAPAFALAGLLFCAVVAHRNVVLGFVAPQVKELRMVSAYLQQRQYLQGTSRLYFVPAPWQDSMAPFIRYDEFGTLSSSERWVLQGMVWLILTARHAPTAVLASTAQVGPIADAPIGATVISFDEIVRDAKSPRPVPAG